MDEQMRRSLRQAYNNLRDMDIGKYEATWMQRHGFTALAEKPFKNTRQTGRY
ncbi:MAG: hypothetical protein WC613_01165 [Candidatus Aenigmatarchaeota archaeon]